MTKATRKRNGITHDHQFGTNCPTCVREHPQDHQQRRRLSARTRRLTTIREREKLRAELNA